MKIKEFYKKNLFIFLPISLLIILFSANIFLLDKIIILSKKYAKDFDAGLINKPNIIKVLPTVLIQPSQIPQSFPRKKITPSQASSDWGVAKQIDKTTWTIRVSSDPRMATEEEVFEALNSYRERKGVGKLAYDQKLSDFAKMRAETFVRLGKLDGHSGFEEYLAKEENIKQLGFLGLGENSSYGFRLLGVHLIEWIFASDPPHESNQLDPSWTHVGIGVKETAVDIVFGKNRFQ